jgi:hypothetical protein
MQADETRSLPLTRLLLLSQLNLTAHPLNILITPL